MISPREVLKLFSIYIEFVQMHLYLSKKPNNKYGEAHSSG